MHFSLYVLTRVKVFLSGHWPGIALSVNLFVSAIVLIKLPFLEEYFF